jgi:hypothetical protein
VKQARTSFLKKRSKKLLLIAGIGAGSAVNRHRGWRLTALPAPTPAGAKFFARFFLKKRCLLPLGFSYGL